MPVKNTFTTVRRFAVYTISTRYRKNRYRVKSYEGWAISNRIDIASGMCNNINIELRSLYWVPELSESYRNRLRGSKIIRIVSISYYGCRGLSISYQYRLRSVWEYHIVSTMKKPISHNTDRNRHSGAATIPQETCQGIWHKAGPHSRRTTSCHKCPHHEGLETIEEEGAQNEMNLWTQHHRDLPKNMHKLKPRPRSLQQYKRTRRDRKSIS